MPDFNEERKFARAIFRAPIVVHWRSPRREGFGTVSNMSRGGCYILTPAPAPASERIFVQLEESGLPEIECDTRYVDAEVGMGVEFREVPPETLEKFERLLKAEA